MLKFTEDQHLYESIVPDGIKWLSITTLVHALCPPFDASSQAQKSSVNRKSKWYGTSPTDILTAWDNERKRSTNLGTWLHNKNEQTLYNLLGITVHKPIMENGVKIAPKQLLTQGIYPEHFVYLKSSGICGQTDKAEVKGNVVDINDYKTSKKIRRNSYSGYNEPVMMLRPVHHLEDCEYWHYALQLSLYMYIILKHNPLLVPGTLTIEHVKFAIESTNKWGYPIHKLVDNEPVIEDIEYIQLPYLKSEVSIVLDWLKNNRNKVKK